MYHCLQSVTQCFYLGSPAAGELPSLRGREVELPKWHLKNIKELNRLEKWLSYFSKKTSQQELEEIAMSEPMIRQALNAEVIFTEDQIKRRAYEKAEKAHRDHIAILNYAVSKSRAEGVVEGRTAEAERIAGNMLLQGIAPEMVAQISGLSLVEVQKLVKK